MKTLTTSSRVIINEVVSEFFQHKRGLRQRDPLSPMLFNLVSDTLQRMFKAANILLKKSISPKVMESIVTFQYTDDKAVIASVDLDTTIALRIILKLFIEASELHINYHKSTMIPLNITQSNLELVNTVIGWSNSQFPIMF